jgi:hypothetical protein
MSIDDNSADLKATVRIRFTDTAIEERVHPLLNDDGSAHKQAGVRYDITYPVGYECWVRPASARYWTDRSKAVVIQKSRPVGVPAAPATIPAPPPPAPGGLPLPPIPG